MADCCSSTHATSVIPRKHRCPVCDKENIEVSVTTIIHHIKEPWRWQGKKQGYYFCEDPECDVVYFAQDDSLINKNELRTVVGIKEKSVNAPVCYCFGVSAKEANENPEVKAFVLQKTKEHICACEIRNPSGRCCLKDFPE